MIKSLLLKNFQAHKKLKIVLAPGITSIVGSTDAGKSSIVRALRWACLNELSGDAFIRRGAKRAVVRIRIGDRVVLRAKGTGGNRYVIDGKPRVSFGTGVPEEVAGLLEVNEINFQGQHDSPFWFAESAPEVSRQLNRVVDISLIDTAMTRAGEFVRKARASVGFLVERIVEKKGRLEELAPDEARVEKFNDLKELYEELLRIQSRHTKLEELVCKIDDNNAEVLQNEADALENLVNLGNELNRTVQRKVSLDRIILGIEEASSKVKSLPDFERLSRIYDGLSQIRERAEALKLYWEKIERKETIWTRLEAVRLRLEEKLSSARCPACGRANDNKGKSCH